MTSLSSKTIASTAELQPPHAQASVRGRRRWRASSLTLIFAVWAVLQIGGLFTPGLMDDVDSVYIQVARGMLQRHDFITPTVDGIRFFDKPPLMYWMAAGSMHLFGIHDWAGRLPLALGVLALLLAAYALGIRFYSGASPAEHPDRGGLYAALILATSIGPYLYTRFYIPDILIALWMTISIHLFLIALDRIEDRIHNPTPRQPSALLPCLGFAAVTAVDLLTKGFIGIVFPLGFVLLYLAITGRLKLLGKFHLIASTVIFLVLAAPWHILAAVRNPPISMPAGMGLPARAGWAWFYLYNEHIARFLGRRIPHDYGQVPIPIFWTLLLLWLLPWVAFLPASLKDAWRSLRRSPERSQLRFDSDQELSPGTDTDFIEPDRAKEAALSCLLWAGVILGFFTLSSRQEYYHLPALPALALLVAGLLAQADAEGEDQARRTWQTGASPQNLALRQVGLSAIYFLVPLGLLLSAICSYFAVTSPTPQAGATLNQLLSSNPGDYDLSLGHIFDLTGRAMGFFRGPLLAVAFGMFTLGPIAYFVRRRNSLAANLLIAAAMTGVLLAAHQGLVRFYPILGSKGLAVKIDAQYRPGDLVIIDGELTAGSTLLFYTPRSAAPVLLVNGRRNGPWFGSFYPDAPKIFLDDAQLDHLWAGAHRIFLLTYHPAARAANLIPFAPVYSFASSGGKTVLSNQP
ncbi:MAG: ArnT family glycosyltransferase [Acidobacteriota bacterium]